MIVVGAQATYLHTEQALTHLRAMFCEPDSTGSAMAGRAEEGIGDPAFVAASVSALATDLLAALER